MRSRADRHTTCGICDVGKDGRWGMTNCGVDNDLRRYSDTCVNLPPEENTAIKVEQLHEVVVLASIDVLFITFQTKSKKPVPSIDDYVHFDDPDDDEVGQILLPQGLTSWEVNWPKNKGNGSPGTSIEEEEDLIPLNYNPQVGDTWREKQTSVDGIISRTPGGNLSIQAKTKGGIIHNLLLFMINYTLIKSKTLYWRDWKNRRQ